MKELDRKECFIECFANCLDMDALKKIYAIKQVSDIMDHADDLLKDILFEGVKH